MSFVPFLRISEMTFLTFLVRAGLVNSESYIGVLFSYYPRLRKCISFPVISWVYLLFEINSAYIVVSLGMDISKFI